MYLNEDAKIYEEIISNLVEESGLDEIQPLIASIEDECEDEDLDELIEDFLNFNQEYQNNLDNNK